MLESLKKGLKGVLPRSLYHLYNRLISKRIIRRRMGGWFEIDWKQKAADADEKIWLDLYNRSWDNWDEQDLTSEDFRRIGELIPDNATILDVGCGDGYLLSSLRAKTENITGADLSSVALKRAVIRLGSDSNLIQCSAEHLPFRNKSYDVVLSAHTLEHVLHLDRAISELKRVSSDKLIILVPSQEYLPYTEDYHVNFFPKKQDLLDAVGLPQSNCIRYTTSAGEGKFGGDVLLLIADNIHD